MTFAGLNILIVLCFSLIDIFTGFIGAVKTKTVKSGSLRDGIFKKFGYLLLMVLCFLIDECGAYIGLMLSVELLPVVVVYLAITEITSIIENLAIISPDIKRLNLLKYFNLTTEDTEESEDEED